MPLGDDTTVDAMDIKVQDIVNNLPQSSEEAVSWNIAQAWAPVATAFFSAAEVPSLTDEGKQAGESAFVTACQASTGTTNSLTQEALAAGFIAYAGAVVAPGNCLPAAPVVHAPPSGPLVLNLAGLPPSETTKPSTRVMYTQLLAWATTGTQTTPGTPPVTVPWS